MNFKSIIAFGLGLATVGLSVPAFADSATVVTTSGPAIVTGENNQTDNRYRRHRFSSSETFKKEIPCPNPLSNMLCYELLDRTGTKVKVRPTQQTDIVGDKNTTTDYPYASKVGETPIRNK